MTQCFMFTVKASSFKVSGPSLSNRVYLLAIDHYTADQVSGLSLSHRVYLLALDPYTADREL